jgi:Fe-S cluster assembly protein SufD
MANTAVHVFAEEGASVQWLQAIDGAAQGENLHFGKLTARVDRDARLVVNTASTGSKLARSAFSVDLVAPGAEAELSGATVLTGARQSHNFVNLRHLAPHCASRQHFKTVAAEKSRSSVDGGIFVAEGAQLTNANQLINNLMLSDEARADSKPRLMIHADDVKCSHGATIGKLDAGQQFYLESRGLTAAQARTLLTVAFIDEVVSKASAGAQGYHEHLERTLVDTLRKQAAP